MITWTYNDGGRKAAGFTGNAGDCACRSLAIVTGRPYQEIYDALNDIGKTERSSKRKRGKSSARTGVYGATLHRFIRQMFPAAEWVPTMGIGTGCKVHLRADELPRAALLVFCSRHFTTMMYGVIHDTHNPSRDGTRCVYGYYRFPAPPYPHD